MDADILKILLVDRTTKRNIIWATSDYEEYGEAYKAAYPITLDLITGERVRMIQPRNGKAKPEQANRTKKKAEVSTPSWLCNEQNNLVDSAWFGKPHVFNIPEGKSWRTNESAIEFEDRKGRRWTDYVDAKRLEIACGEAPYLTSRYDMTTGNLIEVKDRIGLLDRKLRIVNENTDTEEEWLRWAYRACESIYGFEFQGDSLLLARKNLLDTFTENMMYKFNRNPTLAEQRRTARILSWNLWQMDGLSFTVPFGTIEEQYQQLAMVVEGTARDKVYCRIHDWRSKVTVTYCSLAGKK